MSWDMEASESESESRQDWLEGDRVGEWDGQEKSQSPSPFAKRLERHYPETEYFNPEAKRIAPTVDLSLPLSVDYFQAATEGVMWMEWVDTAGMPVAPMASTRLIPFGRNRLLQLGYLDCRKVFTVMYDGHHNPRVECTGTLTLPKGCGRMGVTLGSCVYFLSVTHRGSWHVCHIDSESWTFVTPTGPKPALSPTATDNPSKYRKERYLEAMEVLGDKILVQYQGVHKGEPDCWWIYDPDAQRWSLVPKREDSFPEEWPDGYSCTSTGPLQTEEVLGPSDIMTIGDRRIWSIKLRGHGDNRETGLYSYREESGWEGASGWGIPKGFAGPLIQLGNTALSVGYSATADFSTLEALNDPDRGEENGIGYLDSVCGQWVKLCSTDFVCKRTVQLTPETYLVETVLREREREPDPEPTIAQRLDEQEDAANMGMDIHQYREWHGDYAYRGAGYRHRGYVTEWYILHLDIPRIQQCGGVLTPADLV
ncbi:hypothetical protein KIPB_008600 [Kipferlia bialata]|uniref:Uncharacterized protein n=1 Tax=Kipferlia bialata TaxID=797122 RepID=A0A9K3GLK9_9EUKA|nr:hypothetical protein KIPB_008600 [Kipferlia bialata]|eukprot:g8600.t1